MKRILKTAALAGSAGILLTGTALAELSATATTDLNIRSGPGPTYPAVGVIDGGDQARVLGCVDGSKWCQVTYEGKTGWSYSDYLMASASGQQRVVVTERRATTEVPVVEHEGSEGAAVGAAGGAVAGALIGGPVGAAVGGVAGATAGAVTDPPKEVRTYVTENRVEPVYLEGEVVVGAKVPDNVQVRPVPQHEYSYVYVNGQPVLVEPQSRQIVHIYR